jgi:hypothetical protein
MRTLKDQPVKFARLRRFVGRLRRSAPEAQTPLPAAVPIPTPEPAEAEARTPDSRRALLTAAFGAIGGFAGTMLLNSRPAYANMPVIDASNLAEAVRATAQMMEEVQQTKNAVGELTTLRSSIGQAVDIKSTILEKVMSVTGVDGVIGQSRSLASLKPNLTAFGGSTDFSTPDRALTAISKNLRFSADVMSGNGGGIQQVSTARLSVARDSFEDALGAALHNRSLASTMPTRVNSLAGASASSAAGGTLRDQTAVTNSILLSVLEELGHIRNLLAVHVQSQAATGMASFERPIFSAQPAPPRGSASGPTGEGGQNGQTSIFQ